MNRLPFFVIRLIVSSQVIQSPLQFNRLSPQTRLLNDALRIKVGGHDIGLLRRNGKRRTDITLTVRIIAPLVKARLMQIHDEENVIALMRAVLVHTPPISANLEANLPAPALRLPRHPVADKSALYVAD